MKSVADFRKLAALARTDDELMDAYRECVDGHEVGNIGRFNQVLIEHKERISLLADFEFLKVKEQINKDDPQDRPKEKPIRRKRYPKKTVLPRTICRFQTKAKHGFSITSATVLRVSEPVRIITDSRSISSETDSTEEHH